MERGEQKEGQFREMMATYFVSIPSFEQQTVLQKQRTKRKLSALWRAEIDCVLRSVGASRLMRQGDVIELVVSVLRSAVILTGQERSNFSVITPLHMPRVATAIEPRLLQFALISLLKDNVNRGSVTAEVNVLPHSVRICVNGERLRADHDRTLPLLQETARLHGGNLAVDSHSISLELNTKERGEALYAVPSVWELTHALTAIPVMGLIKYYR